MEYAQKNLASIEQTNMRLVKQQLGEYGAAIEALEKKTDTLITKTDALSAAVQGAPAEMLKIVLAHIADCPYRRAADDLAEDTTRDVLLRQERQQKYRQNRAIAQRKTGSWIPRAMGKIPKPVWYGLLAIVAGVASKYGIDISGLLP